MKFQRLSVYYAPSDGAFADSAAAWLAGGHGLPVAGAARYGFHGTLRAPFRPRPGLTAREVGVEVAALAARCAPAATGGLRLAEMDGFLALVPDGDSAGIDTLAARVVEATDALRAPLTPQDIARRQPERLGPRARELLMRWGYPFVMDCFRFHLTLTDRLEDPEAGLRLAETHFAGVLPRPFVIADLCLFGEDAAGRFHLLDRYALTG